MTSVADYVRDRTAVIVAVYDRLDMAWYSLDSTKALGADVFIFSDGPLDPPDQFDEFGYVTILEHQDPDPRMSVAKLRNYAMKVVAPLGYEYLMHSDSDMFYDPTTFEQIARLMQSCKSWEAISVFNPGAKDWENRIPPHRSKYREHKDWYLFGLAGGSFFMRSPIANMEVVDIPEKQAWYGYLSKHFAHGNVCISRTSYCEHMGPGIHGENPARNPSQWLVDNTEWNM